MRACRRREKMKRWKKRIAAVGIGVLIASLGIVIWQRENAWAIWEGMTYNENELKTQMENSKEIIQEALQEYEIEGIGELSVEEEEHLMKGEISVEEAVDIILNQGGQEAQEEEKALAENQYLDEPIHSAANNDSVQESEVASNNGGATRTEVEQIVKEYVEKMYVMQVTFLSELGKIELRAKEAFAQLPKEEGNLSAVKKLAPSFMGQGLGLEKSCDNQVNVILNEFESELKKLGASTEIVETMRESYQTQKRLKKAQYLSAIQ